MIRSHLRVDLAQCLLADVPGREFVGRVLDKWAPERDMRLQSIHPRKPVANALVEGASTVSKGTSAPNLNWFTDAENANTRSISGGSTTPARGRTVRVVGELDTAPIYGQEN